MGKGLILVRHLVAKEGSFSPARQVVPYSCGRYTISAKFKFSVATLSPVVCRQLWEPSKLLTGSSMTSVAAVKADSGSFTACDLVSDYREIRANVFVYSLFYRGFIENPTVRLLLTILSDRVVLLGPFVYYIYALKKHFECDMSLTASLQ